MVGEGVEGAYEGKARVTDEELAALQHRLETEVEPVWDLVLRMHQAVHVLYHYGDPLYPTGCDVGGDWHETIAAFYKTKEQQ